MAYKPHQFSNVRDETYTKQIAEERPALMTRVIDSEDYSTIFGASEATLRGKRKEAPEAPHDRSFEGVCERFNRELRSGLGTGRPTNDE